MPWVHGLKKRLHCVIACLGKKKKTSHCKCKAGGLDLCVLILFWLPDFSCGFWVLLILRYGEWVRACTWWQQCHQGSTLLRQELGKRLQRKADSLPALSSQPRTAGSPLPSVSLLRVPIMPSNWIMPLSGIISSCWGIQTFVFIKARSRGWLNDQPCLINMWIQTMHGEFKCLLAKSLAGHFGESQPRCHWIQPPYASNPSLFMTLQIKACSENNVK